MSSLGWSTKSCAQVGNLFLVGVLKGIEQHVNAVVDEGVSMELDCHITYDVKNNL
jgi:hypothetical protein